MKSKKNCRTGLLSTENVHNEVHLLKNTSNLFICFCFYLLHLLNLAMLSDISRKQSCSNVAHQIRNQSWICFILYIFLQVVFLFYLFIWLLVNIMQSDINWFVF